MLYIYYHIFTLNKYLIPRTIGPTTWWRKICWQAQRSDFVVVFSAGLHRSWRDFGPLLFADPLQILKVPRLSLHRFLMGFRSGDWLGHSITVVFTLLLPRPYVLGHCHVGRPIHNPFSVLSLREGGCRPKCPGTWPHSSSPRSCPVPLAEKHPQSIRFPPPCFTVGMVFLGLYSAFLFLQTRRVKLMPNSSILVSSDHITFSQASSGSSGCSLANFSQTCTCAFFSRGTLRTQQDFNPSWCSVLLMVLFVTVVPTAFRSSTSSSCVVLG